MRIFVTGGSGFIGSNLVKRLCAEGHEVGITNAWGENDVDAYAKKIKPFGRSIRRLDDEAHYFNDIVFHQAANNDTQSADKEEMFEANFFGPQMMFEKFAKAGCKKFIYASSTAVYGNSPAPYDEETTAFDPLTPYAESKMEFDKWAMEFARDQKVSVLGLRYCNVYGPGENHKEHRASMIRQMISQVCVGERPKLFWDGSQRRDWCYIKDVIRANLLGIQFDGAEIMNIGCGRSWSFHQIMDCINKHSNQRYKPQFISNPFPRTYQSYVECKIDKATNKIGYNPLYDIDSGIEDYIRNWT